MTGAQVLAQAIVSLKAAGIADPARDARRLLAHAWGIAPGRLTLILPEPVSDKVVQDFDTLITRRANREPISHLIGTRAFFGRDFHVSPDVLDPRPETETLVHRALESEFTRVLDLGTGSGCILLTLLAENPLATGLGTDLSDAALTVAKRNAEVSNVAPRAKFGTGAWYDAVDEGASFDLIVSNPPYIAQDEMPGLAPELSFEPRMALTDDGDGLSAYRAITQGAGAFLRPNGRLIVEIGPTQAKPVSELFAKAGFGTTTVHPDLDGRDRIVSGVFPPQTDG